MLKSKQLLSLESKEHDLNEFIVKEDNLANTDITNIVINGKFNTGEDLVINKPITYSINNTVLSASMVVNDRLSPYVSTDTGEFTITTTLPISSIDDTPVTFNNFEFSVYGENLVSNDLLKKYISKILKWCKKNYNRMSQIKKIEKAYNQKYYLEHKVEKGIKSRDEVNKINGAKRHQNSKT